MTKRTVILGINAYHPDSSAALIIDGNLVAAVEEERFNRIKHWAGFPQNSIAYCLHEAGIGISEVDHIALNRDPGANFCKKAFYVLGSRPPVSLVANRLKNIVRLQGIRKRMEGIGAGSSHMRARVWAVEHHRAHLASSFFVSDFQDATLVSLDGFGDFTSCMVALGHRTRINPLYEINYPHSLGIFYTAVTQFLGFTKFGDEYKVMGLAAYGKPSYADGMRLIVRKTAKGTLCLDPAYFSFLRNKNTMLWDNTAPVLQTLFSDKFKDILGKPRRSDEEITNRHFDIAASLQFVFEDVFFHILNHAYSRTKNPNLCLAGGCALNSLANGKIFDHTPFRQIYIQPNASDGGGSLGAAFFVWHQSLGKTRSFVMKHAYWGPGFDERAVHEVLDNASQVLKERSCVIECAHNSEELCQKVARAIADGNIVGWFQGRMEWGPRALGNRSILVDPRRKEMQEVLNSRIKRREWFRPFAPSILLERTGEYFEKDYPDPFMLKVYMIREEKRDSIPAVTHVDGTGRLQTVSKDENPLYWELLHAFERLTGVPVLLNTSFNENEPIVCRPQEALECFLRTRMDMLVLGPYSITRKALTKDIV